MLVHGNIYDYGFGYQLLILFISGIPVLDKKISIAKSLDWNTYPRTLDSTKSGKSRRGSLAKTTIFISCRPGAYIFTAACELK